jgi:hypothetical protein
MVLMVEQVEQVETAVTVVPQQGSLVMAAQVVRVGQ